MLNIRKSKKQLNPTFSGYTLSEQPLSLPSHRALICLLKGLLIFSAAYGTIGGTLSCFQVPCSQLIIGTSIFIFSMFLSFLHYNKILFNIAYPFLFLFFAFSIIQNRHYANSGYQAFLNILYEKYSTYFNLATLRETSEYYSDRYLTITVAAIYISFFVIVLLNIAISDYMSLFLTFLLTFPLIQIGIFISLLPAWPFILLLLFCYLSVAVLGSSRHFLLPYHNRKYRNFQIQKKKELLIRSYHADGYGMLQLTLLFFSFSILLGALSLPFLQTSTQNSEGRIRHLAEATVKTFVQSGISGFFNRYSSTGGVNGGQLGGISSVRPDYQTDLTLTFVPYSYDTIYLKAYTGATYTGHSWENSSLDDSMIQESLGDSYAEYTKYTSFLESNRLAHYCNTIQDGGILGKMRIKNISANQNYVYLPYYSNEQISTSYSYKQGTISGISLLETPYEVSYYPLLHDYWNIHTYPDVLKEYYGSDSQIYQYISYYDMFNHLNYLTVPTNLESAFEPIKAEIGTVDSIDEQIALIQQYLSDHYTYTLTPGNTPVDEDFVSYFLNYQKKGYCVHFASAAALLLRSYGIPARYIEGYAVSFREVSKGQAVSETGSDWFQGENPIGETGLVSVDVTDADAHAWVEVYKNGFGWVPYEFTPPSSEENDGSYSDFWDLFQGFLSPDSNSESSTVTANTTTNTAASLSRISSGYLTRPLLIFLFVFMILPFLFWMIFLGIRKLNLFICYQKGEYDRLAIYYYQKLGRLLYKKQIAEHKNLLPFELCKLLSSCFPDTSLSFEFWSDQLEKCCFSQNGCTKKEADSLLHFEKKYIRLIKKYHS